MKERPILFSAPMVRAILEGRKTQTRRIVKPQPYTFDYATNRARPVDDRLRTIHCPYGQPGDRLWVRESGWERPERTPKMMREGADTWPKFAYAADNWSDDDRADFKRWGFKVRPSIHMPRWASRILLEIVSVRVERLNDISEADCLAEGVRCTGQHSFWVDGSNSGPFPDAADAYGDLWESINGPGSWAANPWVWAVEFLWVTT